MYTLSPETDVDFDEVEYLYDLAFAPGREALSSYRLRDGVSPILELCLIARDVDGILGGAIRYWPILIEHSPALLLGPVAVHPTRQGEGLGGLLIRESLKKARDLKWDRVVLVGDEPYYGKFGFERLTTVNFPPPTNLERVLGMSLIDGGFDGVSGLVCKYTN